MSRAAVAELSRLVRPLLLPPIVIGAIALSTLSLGWAIAVVTVILTVGLWVYRGEPEAARAKVRAGVGARLSKLPTLATLGVTLASLPVDGAYTLLSDGLIWVAFLAWGAAVVLRLVAFARTTLRKAFVALAAATACLEFVVLFVPAGLELGTRDVVLAVVLLIVLAITSYAESDWGPVPFGLGGEAQQPGANTDKVRTWGLSLAVVASVAFACASAVILLPRQGPPPTDDLAHVETRLAGSDDRLRRPELDGLSDGKLAATFSPILQFSDSQRWQPTDVASYLKRAELRWHQTGRLIKRGVTQEDLRRSCPSGYPSPCFELTIRCPTDEAGRKDRACDRGAEVGRGIARGGKAYVRVLRWGDPRPAGLPPHVPRVTPFEDEIETLVQYWYFYEYDDWRARTLYGHLRQSHEADWEAVTIGFSAEAPLFVALSAHCGGSWIEWDDVRLAVPKAKIKGDLHPMVAVAEGSMAMYADPSLNEPPDWAGCAGIPSREASVATLAYNVREQLGEKRALAIAEHEQVDERHPVMAFPGFWGMNGSASFETVPGKIVPLPGDRTGPRTPTHQRLWFDPLETIFCRRAFRQVGGTADRQDCDGLRERARRRAKAVR